MLSAVFQAVELVYAVETAAAHVELNDRRTAFPTNPLVKSNKRSNSPAFRTDHWHFLRFIEVRKFLESSNRTCHSPQLNVPVFLDRYFKGSVLEAAW